MRNIRKGVSQLLFRQRTSRPVGKTRTFIQILPDNFINQRFIGNRLSITTERRCYLRIKNIYGNRAGKQVKNFYILPASVKNFYQIFFPEQCKYRL